MPGSETGKRVPTSINLFPSANASPAPAHIGVPLPEALHILPKPGPTESVSLGTNGSRRERVGARLLHRA